MRTVMSVDRISKTVSLVVIITGVVVLVGWLLLPFQMILYCPALAHLTPNNAASVVLIAFSLRLSDLSASIRGLGGFRRRFESAWG